MDRRQVIQTMLAGGGFLSFSRVAGAEPTGHLVSARDTRVRQAYLNTENGQLHYWTAGNGPNLVLVHQSANSAEEYAALVPLLADRYRLVAVDLPGHGRSDDPITLPTVDDYTDAVHAVIRHLNIDRTHLLGHHGGALTAMNLASRHAQLIDKTILSGTGGVKTPEQNEAFLRDLLKTDRRVRRSNEFVANMWDRYVNMMSDGASYADILKPFVAGLGSLLRPYRAIEVYLKWDRREALFNLKGPVLLVQGEKDTFVSGQEELLSIIPNSERIELSGCGTFAFYDKPEVCAEMIARYLR